jgi:predicted ABC-type ATPase
MGDDVSPYPARITVLAGVNGSGKSSIMGELLLRNNAFYFNPDTFARQLMKLDKRIDLAEANSRAWHYGKDKLIESIANKSDFAFETTLGAGTIPNLLRGASVAGLRVTMWYCGLKSPELNIRRVAARVSRGGHDIPEEKIRERWQGSRENLVNLIPFLEELKVYDNSTEASEATGFAPAPELLLHFKNRAILYRNPDIPDWAKPIIAKAMLTAGEI